MRRGWLVSSPARAIASPVASAAFGEVDEVGMLTLGALAGLMAVFFFWGFFVARARGRSGIMWGLACALTAFIGIAILYSLGQHTPPVSRSQREAAQDHAMSGHEDAGPTSFAALAAPPAAPPSSGITIGETADERRWRYLCEYHPEVRKAVSAVSLLGEDALGELKSAHLAVNDTGVLPAIVHRLTERFGSAVPPQQAAALNGRAKAIEPPVVAPEDGDDEEEPLVLDTPALAQPAAAVQRPPMTNGALISTAPPATDRSLRRETAAPPPTTDSEDEGEALAANVEDEAPTEAADGYGEDEAPAYTNGHQQPGQVAAPPVEAVPAVPERTAVTPSDLQGAKFLETYAGVHLFGLADGRVFIDRHEARGSLDLARNFVDQVASHRANG